MTKYSHNDSETALMKASEHGNAEIVEALLNHGAMVDEKNKVSFCMVDSMIVLLSSKRIFAWCFVR
jgi:ankyrin repeat protein